ncbi:hypothetical protein Ctob_001252 [Chrysochromulina tobinii]|uniref:Uncharacterized protein n=1 Tax=Chrysochromulina tobinii TaxID=1460289 RepID=A0A0M0JDD1_9EUKA|nr:hypothetical protein Ctob_001252 [Chrysochromulina tobinii]|eukprot:KOO24238.1 hypothetical protein Ctob_001252 [Chrysochromulina sp. CCMP291]
MTELGIDIPQIYHVQNADPAADEATFESITQSLENLLAVQKDYVAKPTHLSCSDQVYVVKNGLNIYSKLHAPVQPRLVAANMTMALRTRSSVWGESWALHHVPPGILIEERISAGGDDDTAALEFKTIVIWGRVWASEVKRGTDTLQILGRDGRGLQGEGQHPDLAQTRAGDQAPFEPARKAAALAHRKLSAAKGSRAAPMAAQAEVAQPAV